MKYEDPLSHVWKPSMGQKESVYLHTEQRMQRTARMGAGWYIFYHRTKKAVIKRQQALFDPNHLYTLQLTSFE